MSAAVATPLHEALQRVLDATLGSLPMPARESVAVLLAGHDYCVDALSSFVARQRRAGVRLRALDSIRLELSQALAVACAEWPTGLEAYVLAEEGGGADADAWVGAALALGELSAAVVCDVVRVAGGGFRVSARARTAASGGWVGHATATASPVVPHDALATEPADA